MRRRSTRQAVVLAGAALVVAAGLVVTAALAFPVHRVGRIASGATALPDTLRPYAFSLCHPDLGSLSAELDALQTRETPVQYMAVTTDGSGGSFTATVEAPGVWRVQASRAGVTVEGEKIGLGDSDAAAQAPEAVAVAQKLYDCLSKYRFVDETTPLATSSQLVQWYKYDTVVLWPCLAAHGIKVGDPPTRADFSDPFRAQAVNPFQNLQLGAGSRPKLLAAVRQCPVRPSYLR